MKRNLKKIWWGRGCGGRKSMGKNINIIRTELHLHYIPAKNVSSESNHEENNKPKLKEIL